MDRTTLISALINLSSASTIYSSTAKIIGKHVYLSNMNFMRSFERSLFLSFQKTLNRIQVMAAERVSKSMINKGRGVLVKHLSTAITFSWLELNISLKHNTV